MNPEVDTPDLTIPVLELVDRAVAEADPPTAWRACNDLDSTLMGEVSEWVEDYTEFNSVYDLINEKMKARINAEVEASQEGTASRAEAGSVRSGGDADRSDVPDTGTEVEDGTIADPGQRTGVDTRRVRDDLPQKDGERMMPELTWRALNPPDPDDFLLEDQDGRIYAHAEQMDDDEWWACCYVIEAWEDPNFGSKKDAFRYCEEMTRLWLFLRGRVKTLIDLCDDNRDPEHARRFDIRLEELPALPREKKE